MMRTLLLLWSAGLECKRMTSAWRGSFHLLFYSLKGPLFPSESTGLTQHQGATQLLRWSRMTPRLPPPQQALLQALFYVWLIRRKCQPGHVCMIAPRSGCRVTQAGGAPAPLPAIEASDFLDADSHCSLGSRLRKPTADKSWTNVHGHSEPQWIR